MHAAVNIHTWPARQRTGNTLVCARKMAANCRTDDSIRIGAPSTGATTMRVHSYHVPESRVVRADRANADAAKQVQAHT
jgi:hypothetical protein